jgi:hypothetical protein
MSENRGIGTIAGKLVDPFNLAPSDINVYEMAWSLSQQNRFMGHTPYPWSVLAHTGLVLQLYVADRRGQVDSNEIIQLLLHDATETYIADIARPLKELPEFAFFRDLETKVSNTIYARFGYRPEEVNWDLIRRYDDQAVHIEYYKFHPECRNTDANAWYGKPLPAGGTVEDFVRYLKELTIQAGKAQNIGDLFALPDVMVEMLENAKNAKPSAVAVEPGIQRELGERLSARPDPILSARLP